MEGMALWKLERRVDLSVNTWPWDVVGERPWTDELLPNAVMSAYGAFSAYLFCMKLVESPNCTNCDRRRRDNDARHTLFECPAFQLYREDMMTILQKKGEQPITPDRLIPIMLKNADGLGFKLWVSNVGSPACDNNIWVIKEWVTIIST